MKNQPRPKITPISKPKPLQQRKNITATSSISSNSVPSNNHPNQFPKEKTTFLSSSNIDERQQEKANYRMIDLMYGQLKQSIDGDVTQQELFQQEKRQKLFDETHQQLNEYKDYVQHFTTHQIPFLQKHKDQKHALGNNIGKLMEVIDQETKKIMNVKNDTNDLMQYFQSQADLLKEKMDQLDRGEN